MAAVASMGASIRRKARDKKRKADERANRTEGKSKEVRQANRVARQDQRSNLTEVQLEAVRQKNRVYIKDGVNFVSAK